MAELDWMRYLVATLLTLSGIALFLRSNRRRLAVPFLGLSLSLGSHVLSRILMDAHLHQGQLNILVLKLNSTTALLANLFFWIFVLRLSRISWTWVHGSKIFLLLPLIAGLNWFWYGRLSLGIQGHELLIRGGYSYLLFFFCLALFFPVHSLWRLYSSHRKSKILGSKGPWMHLFWAALLCFILVTLPSISYFHGKIGIYHDLFADCAYFIFTLWAGFAVFRTREMQFKGALGKLLPWLVLSLGFYLPSAWIMAYFSQELNLSRTPILHSLILAGLLAFLLQTQLRLQGFLDRIFKAKSYYLDQLRQSLSKELLDVHELEQLEPLLSEILVRQLHFNCIHLIEQSKLDYVLGNSLVFVQLQHKNLIARQELAPYIQNPELESQFPDWLALIPLVHHNKVLGALLLCDFSHPRPLCPSEIAFLAELKNTLSLAYSNALAFEVQRRQNLELTELSQNLEHKYLEAEAANRAKDAFLAVISHELRTPLNGMMGFAELLESQNFPTEQKELIQDLLCSTHTMNSQVNQILDYTLLRSQHFHLNKHYFPLTSLCAELSQRHSSSLSQKQIELQILGQVPQQLEIESDLLRLRQILDQFISNAIKFSPTGSKVILQQDFEAQGDFMQVHLSVQDFGIGMNTQQQSKIFEPFHQADSSLKRDYEGMGLGLAIASHLCSFLPAQIHLESTPAQGSTFHLQFTAPLKALENPVPSHNLRPTRILIAEDNAINQKMMCKLLHKLGFEDLHLVENGSLAVEAYIQNDFDLILMDIQMPIMDGIEASRLIRSYEKEQSLSPVPILAVTANALSAEPELFAAVGINEVLPKPLQSSNFKEALERWLKA